MGYYNKSNHKIIIQNNNKFTLSCYNSGQVLLTIVLTIFAISLVILVTIANSLISNMFLLPQKIAYYKSYYAGVSCIDIALLNFKNNISYRGGENIAISTDMNCKILPIESNGDSKLIKVIGRSIGIQRYFLVVIKKLDSEALRHKYKVEIIQEVDSFN